MLPWAENCSGGPRTIFDPAKPPQPFEVEYLAEGKEAERRAKQAGMEFLQIWARRTARKRLRNDQR